ncbi:hypothetical protein ACM66B_006392 [Microbotryomycetes sp. NB124-2]
MAGARFSRIPVKPQPNVLGITSSTVARWAPTLGVWGIGLAGAGALFLSPIPVFQADVLKKIPGVASYFEDKTPDSDKPF